AGPHLLLCAGRAHVHSAKLVDRKQLAPVVDPAPPVAAHTAATVHAYARLAIEDRPTRSELDEQTNDQEQRRSHDQAENRYHDVQNTSCTLPSDGVVIDPGLCYGIAREDMVWAPYGTVGQGAVQALCCCSMHHNSS